MSSRAFLARLVGRLAPARPEPRGRAGVRLAGPEAVSIDLQPAGTTEQALVSAGRFTFVDLAGVRIALGDRWPSLIDKVHRVAEHVIERHLLRGDVYQRHDEGSYIVLFAQLTMAEAEFKCGVISQEIRLRLLGEEGSSAGRLETATALAPREAIDASDLRQAVGEAFAPAPFELPERGSAHGPLWREFAHTPQPREIRLVAQTFEAPAKPCVVWRSFRAPSPDEGDQDSRALEDATPAWRYTPVWDAWERRPGCFRLIGAEHALRRPGMDGHALYKAGEDILERKALGRSVSVVCPIHHLNLLQDTTGPQLTQRLGAFPVEVRRLLKVELWGFDERPWTPRTSNVVDILAAMEVEVWARGPFATLPRLSPTGFGLSVLIKQFTRAQDPDTAAAEMIAFFERTRDAGIESGLCGVDDAKTAEAATAASLRFLSGSAVQSDVLTLEEACSFEALDA